MRKFAVVLLLLIITLIITSCSVNRQEEQVTEWIPTTAETTQSVTEIEVKVKNKKAKIKTKNNTTSKTEPTEEETEVPTQGVENPNGRPKVTSPIGSISDSDLNFVYDGKAIKLHDKIEDVFEIIGEDNFSNEISEEQMEYEYEDFVLLTYIDYKGLERLEKITVTGEEVVTTKGIKLGDSATSLRKIYGDPIKEEDGVKYYGNDKKTLALKIENNLITGIAYEFKK